MDNSILGELHALQNIDLYEILNIQDKKMVTQQIIRKNYKKLALKYHPDKNPDNSDKFELIQLAYMVLSNEETKNKYDEIYEENSKLKDFSLLKKDFIVTDTDIKLTEPEFYKIIQELNIKNNAVETELDINTAIDKQTELLKSRADYEKILKDSYKEGQKVLSKINRSEFVSKFNELFDSVTEQETEQVELVPYNDVITEFCSTNNTSYNTMYSSANSYDEAFKIQKPIENVHTNMSLESKIKQHLDQTKELENLVKFG